MPDETTETTEQPQASDKELNFEKLRQQREALEAELAELRPLRVKETLRQAGFDPDSAEGKALSLAVEAGKVETDPTQIAEYAGSEFGWQPKTQLTETESTQVEASRRQQAVQQASVSDTPLDVQQQIQQLEQDGKWQEARSLKNAALYDSMVQASRG